MIRWISANLRRIRPLRSAYHFWLAWLERVRWHRRTALDEEFDRVFEQPDPWNYTSSPAELDRFRSALAMIDGARHGQVYEQGFEIGCAEGIFTQMLAPRCKSLLAVDITRAALARAQIRCAGTSVVFSRWDLLESLIPCSPDLLVVMDVLELFFKPEDVKRSRDKLVSALQPGGHLFFGGSRQDLLFETTCWGKYMLRGGARIAESFCEHPELEHLQTEAGEIYVNAIFRKRGPASK